MPTKITKRCVEALRPLERPYELRDSAHRGLVVRVEVGGSKVFWLRYALPGKRSCRFKLGRYPGLSVGGARALAKEAAGRIARGVDPHAERVAKRAEAERARVMKLGTFLEERFAPWARGEMKTAAFQLARIRADFKDWLEQPMDAFNRVAIERLRQEWVRGGKQPRTVNRDLQRLGSVLARAVEWGVLAAHPLKGLKPMRYDKADRMQFLSREQERALRDALDARDERMRAERQRFNEWRAARHMEPLPELTGNLLDHLRPLVLVALNAGLRRGELFSLTWGDVDLRVGVVTVTAQRAKSRRVRRVPLNTEALSILTAWHKRQEKPDAGTLVFPGAGGARLDNIRKSWGGLAKLAGLSGFSFHGLRHTFASRIVQAGTDLNVVRTLLGHADIQTTLVYAHLEPAHLRAAVERVAA